MTSRAVLVICATLPRMATTKRSKPHSSTRKKAVPSSKRSRSAAKTKKAKENTESEARAKKCYELALQAFQVTYERYQRGEFQRLQ